MLDEQGEQLFDMTDMLAERIRKIGGTTLRSIAQISKLQSLDDNEESFVPAQNMLRELMNDNKAVAKAMHVQRHRRRRQRQIHHVLGLYHVHHLANALGGSVGYQPNILEGSGACCPWARITTSFGVPLLSVSGLALVKV